MKDVDFYGKSLAARIKNAHAHLARCKAMADEGNTFALPTMAMAERELARLLQEAAERDVPAEMIAEATSYKPVSKLKEEVRLLQGQLEDSKKDSEAHGRRMERVAVIGGAITFVLGIALGMLAVFL